MGDYKSNLELELERVLGEKGHFYTEQGGESLKKTHDLDREKVPELGDVLGLGELSSFTPGVLREYTESKADQQMLGLLDFLSGKYSSGGLMGLGEFFIDLMESMGDSNPDILTRRRTCSINDYLIEHDISYNKVKEYTFEKLHVSKLNESDRYQKFIHLFTKRDTIGGFMIFDWQEGWDVSNFPDSDDPIARMKGAERYTPNIIDKKYLDIFSKYKGGEVLDVRMFVSDLMNLVEDGR